MGGARPSGLCHLLAVTGRDLPLLTRGLSISIPQTAKEATMLLALQTTNVLFNPQHLIVLAFFKNLSVKGSLSQPVVLFKLILWVLCFYFDIEHERTWVKWDLLRGVSEEGRDEHVRSWASSGWLQTVLRRDSCSVLGLWLTGSLLYPC